jgi:hypothetical protein
MQIHVFMSLIIVTMKFCTVSQQLVHVNYCNISAVVVTSDSETYTSVTALNIKQFINIVNGLCIEAQF